MLGIYTRTLAKYPVWTQAFTTGMLFGTGDVIAQFLIEGQGQGQEQERLKEQSNSGVSSSSSSSSISSSSSSSSLSTTVNTRWDAARTGRMMIFGAGFAGPVLHHWYRFLDRKIQLSTPFRSLLGRVTVDQLCFAPCFIASFFVGQGILAGERRETIQARLEKGYPGALRSNYMVWPAVQLLNFWCVPLQHRLMVVNTFALGWNTYLSHVNQTSRVAVEQSS